MSWHLLAKVFAFQSHTFYNIWLCIYSNTSTVLPLAATKQILAAATLFPLKHWLVTWTVRIRLQLREQLINHLAIKCYSSRRYFRQYCHESPSHLVQSWPFGYFFCIRALASGTGFIAGSSGHGILVLQFFISIVGLRLTKFILGSMAAILGMPLTTLVARRDLETVCEFQSLWLNDISRWTQ